jgi:Flp pilus assembly protein TadG
MAISSLQKLLRDFKSDIRGNFGVMAATTTLGLMSAVGLSVDGQRFYAHSAKSQSVADAAGLAAAIHASSNGGMVPTQGATGVFIEGQTYSAKDLGFTFTRGENITFTVDYDEQNKEVNVTTTGTIVPVMLQLIGKEEITTINSSITKYEEPGDPQPASVLFVLDNSGSMWFDDKPLNAITGFPQTNTTKRVVALQSNIQRFNTRLENLDVDEQVRNNEYFIRTGLLTYQTTDPFPNFDNDNDGQVDENDEQEFLVNATPVEWDILPYQGVVSNLDPEGGTNSAPAIDRAETIMNGEITAHNSKGNADPKRYVVFMSDGQNEVTNSNPTLWIARDDTGLFRRQVNINVCVAGRWRFSFSRGFYFQCTQSRSVSRLEEWDVSIDGVQEGRATPAGSGWEEGVYISNEDQATIQACNRMKANDITIYTIGFALEEGKFRTNDWYLKDTVNRTPIRTVEAQDLRRATALLQSCATSPDTFLFATDAAKLDIAFNTIAQDIINNIIRLTN